MSLCFFGSADAYSQAAVAHRKCPWESAVCAHHPALQIVESSVLRGGSLSSQLFVMGTHGKSWEIDRLWFAASKTLLEWLTANKTSG